MNFYKITNKEEVHYGMHYKTGLNEDVSPFKPEDDCESGGIYFTREDILAFLDYGCWIREVTVPEGEPVYENPGEPKKWKAHRVILGKRRLITLGIIKKLLKEGADPRAADSYALRWAAMNGHTDVVRLLLPVSDSKAGDSYALRWAAMNGHTAIVEVLLPVSDPKADDSYALRWAAMNGHTAIVEVLLPVSDPKANDSEALRWAAENGHIAIVELLLPVSDPKAWDSAALRWAAENGHIAIVKLLLPVSDPKALDSAALRWAAMNGHTEIMELLLKSDADGYLAVKLLQEYGYPKAAEKIKTIMEELACEKK